MDLLRDEGMGREVNKGQIAKLQGQIKDFEGYVHECKDALVQQIKTEMARLQSVEMLKEV